MNMKTSENELDILNIFRKLDDAENNIREEKVFEAQTSLAVLRAKYGIYTKTSPFITSGEVFI